MMTVPSFRVIARSLAMVTLTLATTVGLSATSVASPKILKVVVSGQNLVVTASVPKGWQSVTLESRASADKGAWVPRAVVRAKTVATKVTFRIPVALKGCLLRVSGEPRTSYPLSFFTGKSAFSSQRSSLWRSELGSGNAYALAGDGNLQAGLNVPDVTSNTRSVEESDIWKTSGDTLYFFNQYRGLQVIDVSDPDVPVIRGVLSLPGVGEQMYVLDARHVALLARNTSDYDRSDVVVVDVSGDAPRTVATMPMDGAVLESRLVGTALYVAVQSYRERAVSGETEWQWGSAVHSFDLADPSAPIERSTLWFAGEGNAVMATDRYLFVATQGDVAATASVVRVIDISAADGTMRDAAGITAAGSVADKFRMNLSGDVFAVFSEKVDTSLTDDSNPNGTWLTTLETFSLADAAEPVRLGCLTLAPGERLSATRFDGNRAYAVTCLAVDPLWILDLSDPAQPVIAGQVEVPGWSTYIRPMGGRLVTIGADAGRVAVSLFDVSDPAQSGLLSRVPLGEEYSWSEAYWNEKALSVFVEEGLILVPYEGFDSDGYASRVQLVDLTETSLSARGVFDHRCQPRRTALHRGRVLSISGKELLSVDVSDRDHPQVKSTTELSWAVNRAFAQGGYLLQVETPSVWSTGGHAVVRVTTKVHPDSLVNRVDLGAMPVVGTSMHGGSLYLLQSPSSGADGVITATAASAEAGSTNLVLKVLDLSALPDVRVVGQAEVAADVGVTGAYEAVWPNAGLLVWVSTTSAYWMSPLIDGLSASGNPATTSSAMTTSDMNGIAWWPWWDMGGVRLLAFNTDDQANPAFVSEYRFNPSQGWGFSTPIAAQGKIYFSHEQSLYVRTLGRFGRSTYAWCVQEWLDVIDYSDPKVPTKRLAVSIPGQLAGVAQDGALLYLLGFALASSGVAVESAEALHVCTYDGVNAYLVKSLALPAVWPRPVRVDGGRIFLGRASADEKTAPLIEEWAFSDAGKFVLQASATLKQAASALTCFDGLLAVQDTDGGVSLFGTEDTTALRSCGEADQPSGVWCDLNRAIGSLSDGVWFPLDDFGVLDVPVN